MKPDQKRLNPITRTAIFISVMSLALLTLLAIVLGIAESTDATHIAPNALELATRHENKPLLLDVRSKREYDAGHIVGAIHVPFWAPWRVAPLLSQHVSLTTRTTKPLTIYCELGPRAGIVGLWLRLTSATEYNYLDGHMARWRQLDLPTTPTSSSD